MINTEQEPNLNDMLCFIDAQQIKDGAPILSILTFMDENDKYSICNAARDSINRYDLQKEYETYHQTIDRLRAEATMWSRTSGFN